MRAAVASDFDPIAELTNHFIAETAIHFGYEPVTGEALRAGWQGHRARYPTLVAELDGGFAGFCKAGPWRERAAYAWTVETGVYVRPALHRRGVGRALYAPLLDGLRAQGFQTVVAGIALPNDASVRLHEALGFAKVAHVARAGWKFGAWHDVGFWQRDLAAPGSPPAPLGPPVLASG